MKRFLTKTFPGEKLAEIMVKFGSIKQSSKSYYRISNLVSNLFYYNLFTTKSIEDNP